MKRCTKGYVMLEIREAKEKTEEGFLLKDAGNSERVATVIDMGRSFDHIGPAEYNIGDEVVVPKVGGQVFEVDGMIVMVFLQSEILLYEDNQEQGISRF